MCMRVGTRLPGRLRLPAEGRPPPTTTMRLCLSSKALAPSGLSHRLWSSGHPSSPFRTPNLPPAALEFVDIQSAAACLPCSPRMHPPPTLTLLLPPAALEFVDIQSAAAWPGIPEEQVLLQPHEVRTAWREFMSSSNVRVQQVCVGGGWAGRQGGDRLGHYVAASLWGRRGAAFFLSVLSFPLAHNPSSLFLPYPPPGPVFPAEPQAGTLPRAPTLGHPGHPGAGLERAHGAHLEPGLPAAGGLGRGCGQGREGGS